MDYDDDDADNVGDAVADADNVGDDDTDADSDDADVDSHDADDDGDADSDDACEDDWMLHTNVDPSIRCQVGWVTVCIILVMIDEMVNMIQLIKMMNGRC